MLPTRRNVLSAAAATVAISRTASAKSWERFAKPEDAGLSKAGLEAVEQSLYAAPTTSFLVITKGKVAYTYGDIAQVSYLASARKSVLSMLYGKYVANGTIDLKRTIGSVGIDEAGSGLTDAEKSATIRDLLTSSSGVYWPAGSPGGRNTMPARGSHQPGTHFYYSNWGFNVAGEVFQRLTGKSVFDALEHDLARPLEFEDYDPARQRMLGYDKDASRYKAYHMFLSGRDMARLGLLMLQNGRWNGRQILPASWVKESTATHMPNAARDSGYGYLWWTPRRSGAAWSGAYYASGNYGQFLLVLPSVETVIVHRRAVTDEFAIARNRGRTQASPAAGVDVPAFLDMADRIVTTRL